MAGKGVCRVGDMSAGACGRPPIPASISNAVNVLVNGRPPMAVSAYWGTHCNDDSCHTELVATGNPTVLVCNDPIATVSSVLSFGDIAVQGSPNVLA